MTGSADSIGLRSLVPKAFRRRIADWRGRGPYAGYPDAHRCVFIHVPKAAGTAVAQSLFGVQSRHLEYREYELANPYKFRAYFKFAFVRNPWDRLLSAYSFLRRGGMNAQDAAWAAANLDGVTRFRDFVELLVDRPELLEWVHLRPQHRFLCDSHLLVKMDFIGRFETMRKDFATVAVRLGSPARLVERNRSEHQHYTAEYDPWSRRQVGQIYGTDIELFGYFFDS